MKTFDYLFFGVIFLAIILALASVALGAIPGMPTAGRLFAGGGAVLTSVVGVLVLRSIHAR